MDELEHGCLTPGAPNLAERVAHLAERGVRPRALKNPRHQIHFSPRARIRHRRKSRLDRGRVAPAAQLLDALDLLALERRVDPQDLDLLLVLELVANDAHDDPLPLLDLVLVPERGIRDLALEEVLLDRGYHATELLDPVEVVVGLGLEPVRQILEVVGATERID